MNGIHRFLTRRERRSRRDKEEASTLLSRPLYRGLFASESPACEEQEEEKKVKVLEQRIALVGITGLKSEHIQYALRSKSAQGDVDKAFDLLLLLEDSIEGIIRDYTPTMKLLGAENRQGVTCYLDALLFAMFARLDCFEAILYKAFSDEPRRKLVVILRLWVNMLRSGKLITTDVTKHLQDALAACGWEDAARLRQQDASEAFTFITGKLELPLLTLKMDIYHTGKEDVSDDHKFINERLLEVAIPPEAGDGHSVTLEDCLEAYFNNRIEVKRYMERRNTLRSVRSYDSISKGFTAHVESVEEGSSSNQSPINPASPQTDEVTPFASAVELTRSRTATSDTISRRPSIVQERFIPESDEKHGDSKESLNGTPQPRARRGTLRKEVMMPAWQFFSLIPWYTDNTPTNDAQVAAHFSSKRPILGMCLKRYSMLPNGKAVRLNTYVDIPIEIGLPHFIQDDNMEAEGPIYGNFKLSLQAVVCHRGTSVDSGHYIALVRGTSANAGPHSANGSDPPSYTSGDNPNFWMRFDDLAAERITLVDIEKALKDESPYLLFYQILPIDEDPAEANLREKPPSYSESEGGLDMSVGKSSFSLRVSSVSTTSEHDEYPASTSERPSVEIGSPDRPHTQSSEQGGVPQSVTFSEPAATGDSGHLPVVTVMGTSAESKSSDNRGSFTFSRRSSRQRKSQSQSRAGSQAGENRISATFSRLTGRLSKEKLPGDGNETDGEGDARSDAGLEETGGDPTPNGSPNKDRSSWGRAKDRDKAKGRQKDRDRTGKDPERECIVM
ncbi:ubiquitin C-terminal hydrolase family protein [Paecilomyces variotii No. 5]|uniref:ubiquitinyl hydrolase 1 n=1 Tax=Byssochlamys spectabilis (strain No. 5 / NBRC 109023) TaxID=1356009 RepID=V5G967_BYSSN|nr:ubiquitin C-terminal hydrolase family protein [Paecilomyces variotii No. 5]